MHMPNTRPSLKPEIDHERAWHQHFEAVVAICKKLLVQASSRTDRIQFFKGLDAELISQPFACAVVMACTYML